MNLTSLEKQEKKLCVFLWCVCVCGVCVWVCVEREREWLVGISSLSIETGKFNPTVQASRLQTQN